MVFLSGSKDLGSLACCLIPYSSLFDLVQGELKLKPQFSPHSASHHHFLLFPTIHHTIIYPAPFLFCSGPGRLVTGVTNVKSAVGRQTSAISCNAGSESTRLASQYPLIYLNLSSVETPGESSHITSASCASTFAQTRIPFSHRWKAFN